MEIWHLSCNSCQFFLPCRQVRRSKIINNEPLGLPHNITQIACERYWNRCFDFMETTFFGQTCETGQILTITVFLLNEPAFFFKPFRGNWLKISLLGLKIDYLRKKLRITQKVFFPQVWKRGKSRGKVLICLKPFFMVKSLKWDKYYRKGFPLQEPYTAFLLFWSIFAEIDRKLFFWVKKVTISERSQELLRKLFFSTSLKRGKSRGQISI